jgi:hypothetical protein
MKCILCQKEIIKYDSRFHHIKIDDSHEVDICPECMDKIVKWQGKIYSELFPTKALKKRFAKD